MLNRKPLIDTRIRAFTLVELLVVIAIMGILMAMLLPAVQQVREAARRVSCLNNIAQLGLALHNYEFAKELFPSGVLNEQGPITSDEVGRDVGFLVTMLPFIEQWGIAQQFDIEAGTYDPKNGPSRKQILRQLRCPSAADKFEINAAGKAGTSSYAGCHHGTEASIDKTNNGILFLDSRINFSQILDGSSNTILLGEKHVDADDLGWASGTRASLRNTGELLDYRTWLPLGRGANDPVLFVGGFGSSHPGVSNFCLADGSVRGVSFATNAAVLNNLGDRSDGAMTNSTEW